MDKGFVQPARMTIIDVFEGGVVFEFGAPQTTGESTVFPLR